MTTSLDRKLPRKVQALLQRYGADAVLRTTVKTWSAGSVTESSVTLTNVKVSPPQPLLRALVPDDSIFMKAKTVMAAKDMTVVPQVGDILKFAEVDWFITAVNEMRSGESIAAWELLIQQQQQ